VLTRALASAASPSSAPRSPKAPWISPAARARIRGARPQHRGSSGLRLIEPLLAANPDCRILVLTGYASIATTVDAIKLGATQYLAKPADVDAILKALHATDVVIAERRWRRPDVGGSARMGAHPARARGERWKHLGHRPRA
jgi:ActR/RegA family two-component response regulator